MLVSLSRHTHTGRPLEPALAKRLIDARAFRRASGALRQVALATIDLDLHEHAAAAAEPFAHAARVQRELLPVPPLQGDATLASFSHIFAGAYDAGYYSYAWADALAADAYAAFANASPVTSAALGRRFRETVFSRGGSRHPEQVFREFRGRAPSPDALLAKLQATVT